MPPHTFYYSIMDKWVVILFCASVALISLLWVRISDGKYQQQLPIIENFVNVSVLQGLLGMTFWTRKSISTIHKIVCVIISLAGVILGTAYSTYLQSFSVDAPKESPIKTIDDVLHRGIKIAFPAGRVPFLKKYSNFSEYYQNFTIFSNNSEFLLLRNTLDTNYAFSVSDMWPIYDEQQKYFSRPLFRISDICFGKHQLVLPLQKNSVYRQSLNKFILELQEAGLINYWMRHSFVELLEMGVISLEDRNKQPIFVPLKLEDLRVVFMGMGVLLSLSILCFVLEIFWVRIGKVLNSMQRSVREIMKSLK